MLSHRIERWQGRISSTVRLSGGDVGPEMALDLKLQIYDLMFHFRPYAGKGKALSSWASCKAHFFSKSRKNYRQKKKKKEKTQPERMKDFELLIGLYSFFFSYLSFWLKQMVPDLGSHVVLHGQTMYLGHLSNKSYREEN